MVLALTFATPRTAGAQQPDRQSIGTFSIDRAEVTIHAFAAFATATGLVTEAERAGAASSGRRLDQAPGMDVPHALRHPSGDGRRACRACHLG
jgi:formylglycine-generating enzyme required for sulfatase activity